MGRAATEPGRAEGRLCVLLVDDVADNRDVYAQYLEAQGHCVYTASSGLEAIDIAVRTKPDVVVMDLGLPGLDGWDTTRILKGRKETQKIPVLALTAHVYATDRQRAMEAGTVGFVCKPCLPVRLMEEIHLVAEKARGSG